MKTIAVDFDGVVHAYSNGWQDGTIYDPPLPGALEALTALMQTYAVFIHTTRDAATVAGWLADRGFDTVIDVEGPKHPKREFWNEQGALLVTDRKLPAVAYIDDRGIRFQSWKQALAALANVENPPEHAPPTYEKLLTALEGIHALHRRAEYEPVMPIVLAKSNGGRYDDAAVVAGMTCGSLEQELKMTAALNALPRERYIDGPLLEQVDLIAMRHGYVIKRGEVDEASGWQRVGFDWA